METITQAVASTLKMGTNTKPDNSPSGYNSKPYLGKPHLSQSAPGVDGSLDPALTCQYCKDTGTASKGEPCKIDPTTGP